MSNFTNINYSEKIVAFIDGELSPSERESLFLTLASSPQLQEEMRQQLLISRTLKSSLIAPPDALKHNIFASIGAEPSQNFNPQHTFFSKLLNKRVIFVLSSLLVFFILSTIYLLNEYQNLKNFAYKQPVSSTYVDNSKNIPITQSSNIDNDSKNSYSNFKNTKTPDIFKTKIKQSSDFANKNQDAAIQLPTNDSHISSTNELPNIFVIDKSNFEMKNSDLSFDGALKISQLISNIFSRTDFLDKLSMQIRFFEAKNFTNTEIKSANQPILNNFGLTLLYDVDKNNAIAIEIGQEDFQQLFKGNLNDFPTLFKQNYTAFWVGASYQYSHTNYGVIDPYFRAMLGGTRIGPITKLTIGGKYHLTNKLYIFAGLENTALFYEFQNKKHTSLKSGISAGLSVKF